MPVSSWLRRLEAFLTGVNVVHGESPPINTDRPAPG